MALWREGGFAEDIWTPFGDDADLPASGPVVVSLARWLRDGAALKPRAAPVGVAIAAGPQALDHLRDVADRPLVALSFDKFGDGRAFSYAILLRQRYGFAGELRAVGDVLIDEIPLMLRCGFTSFEVSNKPTLRALKEGRLPKFPLAYQPGLARGEAPAGGRPLARRLG